MPYSVFSLNFRSAGKGPFTAGKTKKYALQRYPFLGTGRWVQEMAPLLLGNLGANSSLKCRSLILRPPLRKSAVFTHIQQIKTIDSNSVFNVLFPECVANKVKSCVYLSSTSPYIHSFIFFWHVKIGSDNNLCIF